MEVSVPMMIAIFAGLVFCVVVHECAHGLVANWLGDDTARMLGRLTLNPLPHIDPFMSIILPMLMVLSGAPPFGGAKPVPINPLNFRINRYVGMMLVAAAGPVSNVLLAIGFTLLVNLYPLLVRWQPEFAANVGQWLAWMVAVNLVLALFNLLPLPPLDGSKIVAVLLPRSLAHWIYSYQAQVGGIFVIALLVTFGYAHFLEPAISTCLKWLFEVFVFAA